MNSSKIKEVINKTGNGEWVQHIEFKKPCIIELLVNSQNLGMYL